MKNDDKEDYSEFVSQGFFAGAISFYLVIEFLAAAIGYFR